MTASLFDDLKNSLEGPLDGMGTAFSASLFGLSGSLLLGYLDLQAGQSHNRFFGELEDWLSGQTKLTGGGGVIEGDQPVPAYIQALLEQTAESLDNLQRTISRTETDRLQASNNFKVLARTKVVSMKISGRISASAVQSRHPQSFQITMKPSTPAVHTVVATAST